MNKKTAPKHALSAIATKLGSEHSDVKTLKVDEKLKHLESFAAELKTLSETTETWATETYKKLYLDTCKQMMEVQAASSSIAKALEELRATNLKQVRKITNACLKYHQQLNNTSLTQQQNMPKTSLRYP